MNRRKAIRDTFVIGGAAVGLTAFGSIEECIARPQDDDNSQQSDQDSLVDLDRQAVLAAGFTDAEVDCWKATAESAGSFFALPELHPMDKQEVASAIHIIQNKLLSRPTYRKYLEEAKRLRQ